MLPGRGTLVRPFAANALNKATDGLSFAMEPVTIHDLRRTGATLLTEQGYAPDVIEKTLNHTRTGIRAVYVVAERAEERRRMLAWWADYVEAQASDAKAIVGPFRAATA